MLVDHLYPYVKNLLRMKNNEQFVIEVLKLQIDFNGLESTLDVSKIDRYGFEFSLPNGRIDLLLFHADGGVTIVEAKAQSDQRSIVGGIGQLCLYAQALELMFRENPPKYIDRILVAPIADNIDLCVSIGGACKMAGVSLVALKSYQETMDLLNKRLAPLVA
jgi:hypothetical protein